MAAIDANHLSLPDQVILRVLERVGRPTASTKLVKLVYLVDYTYFQHFGETLSGLKYQWDHFGPKALGHGIISRADALVEDSAVLRTTNSNIYGSQTHLYRLSPSCAAPAMDDAGEMVISDIIAQYGWHSVSSITRESKRTAPFQKAVQYDELHMEVSSPAVHSAEDDWEAHLLEVEERGSVSLEELIEEYGLT